MNRKRRAVWQTVFGVGVAAAFGIFTWRYVEPPPGYGTFTTYTAATTIYIGFMLSLIPIVLEAITGRKIDEAGIAPFLEDHLQDKWWNSKVSRQRFLELQAEIADFGRGNISYPMDRFNRFVNVRLRAARGQAQYWATHIVDSTQSVNVWRPAAEYKLAKESSFKWMNDYCGALSTFATRRSKRKIRRIFIVRDDWVREESFAEATMQMLENYQKLLGDLGIETQVTSQCLIVDDLDDNDDYSLVKRPRVARSEAFRWRRGQGVQYPYELGTYTNKRSNVRAIRKKFDDWFRDPRIKSIDAYLGYLKTIAEGEGTSATGSPEVDEDADG